MACDVFTTLIIRGILQTLFDYDDSSNYEMFFSADAMNVL